VRPGVLETHKFAVLRLVGAELGLNGGAVDAVRVEALSRTLGELHVLFATLFGDGERHLHMHRRNDLGIGQLPNVDVVAAQNAWQILDIVTQFVNVDVIGSGLEENLGRRKRQGKRGSQDDDSDEQRDERIGVQLILPVGEPNDESRDDDANIAQGISEDMKNHGVHPHITVTMTKAAVRLVLLRLAMVMVNVSYGTPSRSSSGRLKSDGFEGR